MAVSISGASGTWAHGNSVTISGVDFTSHADYGGSQSWLNAAWHDFDNGNLEGGNIFMGAEFFRPNWRIVATNNRNNSAYYAGKYYNIEELGPLSYGNPGGTTEVFISFWFRVAPNNQSGKFFRLYGSGSHNIWLATGCENTMIRGLSEGTGIVLWSTPNSFGEGIWNKVEIYAREGYAFWVRMNHIDQWNNAACCPSGFAMGGHTVDFGNMIDGAGRGCGTAGEYGYDDCYVSHTLARVELGNASTLAASTVREIQLPLSWSASSIQVQVNTGAFSNGASAWIYVFDNTGAANANGYPVTINSGSTVIVPVSAFAPSVSSGQSPLSVSFTDQSTNDPTAWSWSFGANSSPSTSILQNPSTTYSAGGAKTVSLAASNSAGTDSTPATSTITARYLKPTNFQAS